MKTKTQKNSRLNIDEILRIAEWAKSNANNMSNWSPDQMFATCFKDCQLRATPFPGSLRRIFAQAGVKWPFTKVKIGGNNTAALSRVVLAMLSGVTPATSDIARIQAVARGPQGILKANESASIID